MIRINGKKEKLYILVQFLLWNLSSITITPAKRVYFRCPLGLAFDTFLLCKTSYTPGMTGAKLRSFEFVRRSGASISTQNY